MNLDRTILLSPLLALALVAGCATSGPTGPPDQVASELVASLDAGDDGHAEKLFARAAGQDDYAERMYPVLYDAARVRYEERRAEDSVAILRFMAPRYPEADAVREALLYSLFLERAGQTQPSPELVDELARAHDDLEQRGVAPLWSDLVATQVAIDRGRLPEARANFDRFLQGWSGQPEELFLYVEDIDRYLRSH